MTVLGVYPGHWKDFAAQHNSINRRPHLPGISKQQKGRRSRRRRSRRRRSRRSRRAQQAAPLQVEWIFCISAPLGGVLNDITTCFF